MVYSSKVKYIKLEHH